jgi:hypothetical protein
MDIFCMVCRYVAAVATTTARSFKADYVLTRAEHHPGGDVTRMVMGKLASGGGHMLNDTDKCIVIWYTYMGQGPFAVYCNPKETLVFPPFRSRDMIPPSDQIIVAERHTGADDEGEDVTELVMAFAGPDGRFHGRMDLANGAEQTFDIGVMCDNWDKSTNTLELTFATGENKTIR